MVAMAGLECGRVARGGVQPRPHALRPSLRAAREVRSTKLPARFHSHLPAAPHAWAGSQAYHWRSPPPIPAARQPPPGTVAPTRPPVRPPRRQAAVHFRIEEPEPDRGDSWAGNVSPPRRRVDILLS